jgi:DNA transformation protein and related proteins
MPSSTEFIAHCLELMAPLGVPRVRRMFGGHGVYLDELFIALIANDGLYLKADEHCRALFEQAGCGPFRYTSRQGGEGVMAYYSVPEEAMESPALLAPWLRLAQAAALRSRVAPPTRRRSRHT